MKKCVILLLTLCLASLLVLPVFATGEPVVDEADLLLSSEEEELTAQLEQIRQTHQMDVVVVTTNSLYGKTPRDYADDFFDENGYGYGENRDGLLLLVSMEDRDWYISTSGYAIEAFTDAGIEYIGEQIVYDLGGEFYMDAFETFASLCDQFILQAETGVPYDYDNLPEDPFPVVFCLIVALIIGAVIALIVTAVMKGQLKSVRQQYAAADYVEPGSLNLTQSGEIFLYHTVSRVEKPKNNGGSSTHVSSSGRTHGGGGGKF